MHFCTFRWLDLECYTKSWRTLISKTNLICSQCLRKLPCNSVLKRRSFGLDTFKACLNYDRQTHYALVFVLKRFLCKQEQIKIPVMRTIAKLLQNGRDTSSQESIIVYRDFRKEQFFSISTDKHTYALRFQRNEDFHQFFTFDFHIFCFQV